MTPLKSDKQLLFLLAKAYEELLFFSSSEEHRVAGFHLLEALHNPNNKINWYMVWDDLSSITVFDLNQQKLFELLSDILDATLKKNDLNALEFASRQLLHKDTKLNLHYTIDDSANIANGILDDIDAKGLANVNFNENILNQLDEEKERKIREKEEPMNAEVQKISWFFARAYKEFIDFPHSKEHSYAGLLLLKAIHTPDNPDYWLDLSNFLRAIKPINDEQHNLFRDLSNMLLDKIANNPNLKLLPNLEPLVEASNDMLAINGNTRRARIDAFQEAPAQVKKLGTPEDRKQYEKPKTSDEAFVAETDSSDLSRTSSSSAQSTPNLAQTSDEFFVHVNTASTVSTASSNREEDREEDWQWQETVKAPKRAPTHATPNTKATPNIESQETMLRETQVRGATPTHTETPEEKTAREKERRAEARKVAAVAGRKAAHTYAKKENQPGVTHTNQKNSVKPKQPLVFSSSPQKDEVKPLVGYKHKKPKNKL